MTAPTVRPYTTANKSAETRDQTGDLQIFSLTLSQLSYRGYCWFFIAKSVVL